MRTTRRPGARAYAALALTGALALTACGSDADGDSAADTADTADSTEADAGAQPTVHDPVVATFDGGLYILDGETLELAETIDLSGFNRINPAGDDRHVMVSTDAGFQVLDAAGGQLTDIEFPGPKPGHVVRHAGQTVLFSDGTGEVTVFDPSTLSEGPPETSGYLSEEPHHGVAVELSNGELVTTLGDEETRTGVMALGPDGEETARNEECPGVHGEAAALGEVLGFGCEDGVLLYQDGAFTKVESPDDYGRIGNQAGSEESAVLLGDYKSDPDAELERPERVSLIDTESGSLDLVDLDTSYSFRSLARGPEGEALVLGTDGLIHVIDPDSGTVEDSIAAVSAWEEPLDWQEARPTIFVRGSTAYVSEPATEQLHAIDLGSGETLTSVTLPSVTNELSGVVAGH